MANHESLADIVLIGSLPWYMKWLSKASIMRVPFLGQMMRMAGDVSVERGSARSRGASYSALLRWIGRGASIMIFPEGTRSRTTEMLPFRNGAFFFFFFPFAAGQGGFDLKLGNHVANAIRGS